MIRPPWATCCAACEKTRKVPRRLVAMTLSKVSTSPLAMGERGMMPALLTTTSIWPKALRVFSKTLLDVFRVGNVGGFGCVAGEVDDDTESIAGQPNTHAPPDPPASPRTDTCLSPDF